MRDGHNPPAECREQREVGGFSVNTQESREDPAAVEVVEQHYPSKKPRHPLARPGAAEEHNSKADRAGQLHEPPPKARVHAEGCGRITHSETSVRCGRDELGYQSHDHERGSDAPHPPPEVGAALCLELLGLAAFIRFVVNARDTSAS